MFVKAFGAPRQPRGGFHQELRLVLSRERRTSLQLGLVLTLCEINPRAPILSGSLDYRNVIGPSKCKALL